MLRDRIMPIPLQAVYAKIFQARVICQPGMFMNKNDSQSTVLKCLLCL